MQGTANSLMLELTIRPHPARTGWEMARIAYNPDNPKHLAQIDAAITAMVHARTAANAAEVRNMEIITTGV